MNDFTRQELAREMAIATLRHRRFAQLELEKANQSGAKKEIRFWQNAVKRSEKLISQYGLSRYDHPGLYTAPDQSGNIPMDNLGSTD